MNSSQPSHIKNNTNSSRCEIVNRKPDIVNSIRVKFITKPRTSFILAVIIACVATSCDELLDIPPNPSDKIAAEEAFSDSTNVMSVMAGVYNIFGTSSSSLGFHSGGITSYTGLSSDELINNISRVPEETPFYANSLLLSTSAVSSLWTEAYASLYAINAALEGIAKSKGLTDGLKLRLTSELKTIRALYFFNLVNLFGEIPLVTNTDFRVNARLPRTPVGKIYELIVADLEEARQLLAPEYPSQGRARPNVYVATALLAKVNLYLGNWQQAAELSGEVIDAGLYFLESDMDNVFLSGSTEAIWQLPFSNAYALSQTVEGLYFVPPPDLTPLYELTPSLLNAFEVDDQRKTNWVTEITVEGIPYAIPYKYKNNSSFNGTTFVTVEDYMILRLSEQYLIRAEARAHVGQFTESLEDLNLVRGRASLADLSFVDQQTLLADIMQERRIELFCEWGNRWYDLKRTSTADAVLTSKPGWQSTDVLYPIPLQEIQRNPFLLPNNPGY